MDQVRVALAWIKKHHFWLLCGIVTLVATGSWYMASTALNESFEKNSKQIKAELTALQQVKSKPFHANSAINDAQEIENQKLAEEVGKLWAELYDRQREDSLEWPKQLKQDFVDVVEGLSFGDDIPNQFRKRYQNYIQEYYPELPKIVKADESAVKTGARSSRRRSSGGGGFGGGGLERSSRPRSNSRTGRPRTGNQEPEQDFLVQWLDQERILDQLEMLETPSALRMWVTQEDLWVYETLLRSIAAVNEKAGADRYTNAAVRDIVALEVGQLAAQAINQGERIFRPESTTRGGEGVAVGGPSGAGEGNARGGPEAGLGDGSETDELLSWRYIDAEGLPLVANPNDFNFGTEFKRLPVRLELKMDQRKLPQLITELSNAPLQIEVTEIRINPETKSGTRRGKSSSSRTSSSSDVSGFSREPTLGDVILRGVVYIYNPVDESVLGIGDDSA